MENLMLFTSESVTEGHPDKLCDAISDAILDAYLEKDPLARVACEVTATTGIITVMGEVTSEAVIDIPTVVRKTVSKIGYQGDKFGFNADTCAVVVTLDKQSEDIDLGVSNSIENKSFNCQACSVCIEADTKELIGAGDQGMMFGYACNETDTLMPAPIFYAHKLSKRLTEIRKNHGELGPDGKSMVSFEYMDGVPKRIDTIVVSVQHLPETTQEELHSIIFEEVILPSIPAILIDERTKILVNPTGRFVKGGPCADTGLTGRKIIVDTYGGMGRHGGGAFSGKDYTKVDRTGAYAARYVAKNIVTALCAERCEVQIAYAIGVAHPVSVNINTFGTASVSDSVLQEMVKEIFDLRPASLIEQFDMKRPIYRELAAYGHFGRDELKVAWERTDKAESIKNYIEHYKSQI
jgi:S-adenosylmethionine synthetase